MKSIQFGRKIFKFKSSFSEFNLDDVKEYMAAYEQYENCLKEYNDTYLLVQGLKSSEVERIRVLQADIDDCIIKIHQSKVAILQSLCKSSQFTFFAENTVGVDYDLINQALSFLSKNLGDFTSFWDACPPVNSFSFRPKGSLLRKNYCIHDMKNNTVVRAEMASNQLKLAFSIKSELDASKWDNINLFCAVITRPLSQKKEIGRKDYFVNSKKLKGLSFSERLTFFSEQLSEYQQNTANKMEVLSLQVAIGLIKEFWKKKANYQASMTTSIKAAVK